MEKVVHTKDKVKPLAEIVANLYDTEIDTFLGNGSYGYAYSTKNGLVVKMTTDPVEAANSLHLVGKKNRNLANVFGVYDFTKYKEIKHCGDNFYAIVLEKLEMKDKGNGQTIRDVYKNVEKVVYKSEIGYNSLSYFCNDYCNGHIGPESLSKLRKCMKEAKLYKHFVELLNLFNELKSNDIPSRDFHTGNIGFKKGRFGMFDLGAGAAKHSLDHPSVIAFEPFKIPFYPYVDKLFDYEFKVPQGVVNTFIKLERFGEDCERSINKKVKKIKCFFTGKKYEESRIHFKSVSTINFGIPAIDGYKVRHNNPWYAIKAVKEENKEKVRNIYVKGKNNKPKKLKLRGVKPKEEEGKKIVIDYEVGGLYRKELAGKIRKAANALHKRDRKGVANYIVGLNNNAVYGHNGAKYFNFEMHMPKGLIRNELMNGKIR